MDVLRWAATAMVVALGMASSAVQTADAAPYAALVMDARTGEVLHSRSADRKLHPASLTKMMTLYLTFEAVRSGRLRLDQKIRVSRHAAGQVPSKIGLRSGRRVAVRDMIRATAVKSANDAAAVLAEAIAGSESAFARLMTKRARELGMRNTTFRNASGLTASGQRSTARDMALLGRALFYDFPQYYNLFGRKKTTAMGRTVHNTNRKLLRNYAGADGIKTGYTNAAGFNLVSSAKRGDKRIIAVVFGGRSSRSRNARVAELLDLGFQRAPATAPVRRSRARLAAISPTPLRRPGAAASPSLLAQASAAIAPRAEASERPVAYSAQSPLRSPSPARRPGSAVVVAAAEGALAPTPKPVFSRLASDSLRGDGWAVQLGVFANEESAIAELASAALSDVRGLDLAGREITETLLSGEAVYRARLTGFTKSTARSACDALKARGKPCLPVAAPAG